MRNRKPTDRNLSDVEKVATLGLGLVPSVSISYTTGKATAAITEVSSLSLCFYNLVTPDAFDDACRSIAV